MPSIFLYSLISVILVSLVSLVGILSFSVREEKLRKVLLYLVSFAAGALLGDVFIHLLPELIDNGFKIATSFYILAGILMFFILEKVVHWHHCHGVENCEHSLASMNLFGEALHNFIDGVIIAASYIVSIPVGFATTIAVILHEIPQELGDFGVLIHSGYSKKKALITNFLIALTAVLGAVLTFFASSLVKNVETYLIPIAIGSFIYIAGSDLIPELHKEIELKKSALQIIAFILGIMVMALLLLVE